MKVKIISMLINYLITGLLSFCPVIIINELNFTTQVYILENILKSDPVVYGLEVFSLYILVYLLSFLIISIIVYIIINKIMKIIYSCIILAIKIFTLILIILIVSIFTKNGLIILSIILLPIILNIFENKIFRKSKPALNKL